MAGDRQKHTEKSHAQQFWSDLLRCFGIIPDRIDLFERDAARASTGGGGYIDLFWSGVALGEAKSLGADLSKAFDQALELPRWRLHRSAQMAEVHSRRRF
ncbi:type IIL restriction-modification enzyme MmeI [Corynebacterium sp. HMSC28B08]|uniref:type IIL restriction-modification enzyme MmeI n=1 Tax=Corynebacterium TaxID=1716 RepID=UPI0008A3F9A8|nr:type IIL restriction-modification enzyme MmeI [Corynebacterium sp. HMSC28B08]